MEKKYSVSLEHIIKDNNYEVIYMPESADSVLVSSSDVNRPGLILSGYDEYFDSCRIQFIGLAESEYLLSLGDVSVARERFEFFLEKKPVALIIARGLEIPKEYMDVIKLHKVPVLRTKDSTSVAMSTLIEYLGIELAPRETKHGVLMEISGVGVLITGESGVGKSETAIELVQPETLL